MSLLSFIFCAPKLVDHSVAENTLHREHNVGDGGVDEEQGRCGSDACRCHSGNRQTCEVSQIKMSYCTRTFDAFPGDHRRLRLS